MKAGRRRPLVVLPTGGGKTVVATHIILDARRRGLRCAFLVHRKELVDQAYEHLTAAGLRVGVIRSDDDRDDADAHVQVISVQTAARRQVQPPDLIVHDEAHRAASAQHRAVLDRWQGSWVVGITATPCRQDGRGLGEVFDALVTGPTMDELVDLGALCRARVVAARTPINVAGVSTTGGDFDRGEIRDRTRHALPDVVRLVREHGAGRRFIAFALDREHSRALAAALTADGIACEHVDGATKRVEREAVFERFRTGQIAGVSNVDLVTEGFDVPACDAVVWARATKSLRVYLQGNGRALRSAPGKADGLILDAGGNVERLGWPTESPPWSIDSGAGGKKQVANDSVRICRQCLEVWPTKLSPFECPRCGWRIETPPPAIAPSPVWRELTREEVAKKTRLGSDRLDLLLELARVARERGYKPAWIVYAAAKRGLSIGYWQAAVAWKNAGG